MGGVVVDTSAWIEFFAGREAPGVADAVIQGAAILPPLVVAELMSGATTPGARRIIGELLQDAPLHETPLEHWLAVGDLRRRLAEDGLRVTIPDAHVAQCAIDRDAVLVTRDAVFARIAEHVALRLVQS